MITANRNDPRGSGLYLTFDSPNDFLATLEGRENPCTAIFHPRDFPTNAVDPSGLAPGKRFPGDGTNIVIQAPNFPLQYIDLQHLQKTATNLSFGKVTVTDKDCGARGYNAQKDTLYLRMDWMSKRVFGQKEGGWLGGLSLNNKNGVFWISTAQGWHTIGEHRSELSGDQESLMKTWVTWAAEHEVFQHQTAIIFMTKIISNDSYDATGTLNSASWKDHFNANIHTLAPESIYARKRAQWGFPIPSP